MPGLELSYPEIFERAIAGLLREYAESTDGTTWIRCASDNVDFTKEDAKRAFPQMLIAASGKYMETEGTTWAVDISVDCDTWYLDDPTCRVRSAMYRDVERILDSLISPCVRGCDDVVNSFVGRVQSYAPDFLLGGLEPTNGGMPVIAGGVQSMNYSATIHFSL